MHGIENKSLWKEEMSYGGETWYMGRIYEEQKKIRLRLANLDLYNLLSPLMNLFN